MKNLRKVLAVVLVVCMAFSLMAVASAANLKDYSDASTVTNKEAVDVMAATGLMTGDGGTAWNPTGTFTREQAARVVASMLSANAGKFTVTTSSFSDVAASRWSAPYIEFAVSRGVISGYGNGKFGPTDPVTGAQFSVMMLKALGYGKNNEFVANWEIYAIDKGLELGILSGSANFSAPATREQVAQYALNSLFLKFQAFSKDTSEYKDTTVLTTFALKIGVVKTLTLVNGVAGYKYENTLGTALTGIYVTDAVLATSTNGTTIAALSTVGGLYYKATLDSSVAYYINGFDYTSQAKTYTDLADYQGGVGGATATQAQYEAFTVNEQTVAQAAAAVTAADISGVIVNFIDTNYNGKADKVTIIQKTIDVADAAPVVNATTGAVTIAGVATVNFPKGTVAYPADLAKNDVVLYYADATGVTNIEKAVKVTGTMTASNETAGTMTFAGASYKASGLAPATVLFGVGAAKTFADETANFGKAATAWIDNNGDIIAISTDTPAASTVNYGVALAYSYTAAAGTAPFNTPASAKVQVWTTDGVVKVYDVAADTTSLVVPNQLAGGTDVLDFTTVGHPTGYLVSYTIDTAGKITVKPAGTPETLAAEYAARSTFIDPTTAATPNLYITSTSKVIYFNTALAYSATTNAPALVTGYANTGTVANGSDVSYVLTTGSTTNIDTIFMPVAGPVTSISGNYAYVLVAGPSMRIDAGVTYYDYTVYINGAVATLTSKTGTFFAAPGLYSYTINAGLVTADGGAVAGAVAAAGTVTVIDAGFVGYVEGGVNKSVAVDSSTVYYKVTATGVTAEALPATGATLTYIQPGTTAPADAIYFTVA